MHGLVKGLFRKLVYMSFIQDHLAQDHATPRDDSPPPNGGSQGIRGGGGLAWMIISRYLLVLTPGNANRK